MSSANPDANPEAIHLSDLRRSYGRVHALDGLTLTAHAGEIYGFLGRNGAGKTTTLRILMGIVSAASGEIELFGERVKKISVEQKQRIGYVSQDQNFYPWMTAKHLGRFVASFYPTWNEHEYARLLKILDVPSDRRAAELSGGTRTKLGLALALAPRPALLLLDEPTTGLDPVARREFNDLVQAMVAERGTAVFFSSHLVDEVASIATRVGIIQAGRMCIEGKTDEVLGRVRHVQSALPLDLPPGFVRVRDNVLLADEAKWADMVWPEGVAVNTLSLEDIFLAFARTDTVANAA
ncbi:MAG: ABC transporter ATP-binding protein [Candidatus Obscuribacterales bacterium]|nr:ABC transporter ATP-binding protein [Steroidobacteraceae bacterium]